jgi:hypothetical protein
MTEWASNEVVEDVGRGLKANQSIEQIDEDAANRGLLGTAIKGGLGGTVGGAAIARLAGGEATVAPFKKMLSKGITKQTLKGLSKLPGSAKLLPLLGLGVGAAGGVGAWAMGRDDRRRQARQVSKGLLSEQVLQQHAIDKARKSVGLLHRSPIETAHAPSPKAVVLGSSGV